MTMYIKSKINEDNELIFELFKNDRAIASFNFHNNKLFDILYNFIENNGNRIEFNPSNNIIKDNFETLFIHDNNMSTLSNKNVMDEIIKSILDYFSSFIEIKAEYNNVELACIEKVNINDRFVYFVVIKNNISNKENDEVSSYITYVIDFNPNISITTYNEDDKFINSKIKYGSIISYSIIHVFSKGKDRFFTENLATKIVNTNAENIYNYDGILYKAYFDIISKFYDNNFYDISNEEINFDSNLI